MLRAEVGLDTVRLKLKISTLKAIVALSCVSGQSLRASFEDECLLPDQRRAVFTRWSRVRHDSEIARTALEMLTREYGLRSSASV